MRYYGATPIASRTLALDNSRVTIDQFYQVVLGSLSAQWRTEPQAVAEFIVTLYRAVNSDIRADTREDSPSKKHRYGCLESNTWFMDLVEAANQFMTYRGHEKQILPRLAAFGTRRAQKFLCKSPKKSVPAFGLSNFSLLFSLLRDDEQRIKVLRHCAKRYGLKDNDLLIRYRPIASFHSKGTLDSMSAKELAVYYEYASAIPNCHESLKRDHDGSQRETCEYHRWIPGYPLIYQTKYIPNPLEVGFCACPCRTRKNLCKNDFECPCCLDRTHPCRERCPLKSDEDEAGNKEQKQDMERNEILADLLDIRRAYFERLGEISFQVQEEDIQEMEMPSRRVGPFQAVCLHWREFGSGPILIPKARSKTSRPSASTAVDLNSEYDTDAWDKETTTYFEFLLGDQHSAALFRRRNRNVERYEPSDQATVSDVSEALSGNCIVSEQLDKHLRQWGELSPSPESPDGSVKKSLQAMSTVKKLYSSLADTTVALEVIHQPLYDTQWARTLFESKELSLQITFSCIALFESGRFDIQPKRLAIVMAMAVGNSIYIAGVVVSDPTQI